MTGLKHGAQSSQPGLPAWKAFVVQFSSECETTGGAFSGRVEHLSSGRRAHFQSPEELIATLQQLLAELGRAQQ
jgi:hypothetical protein